MLCELIKDCIQGVTFDYLLNGLSLIDCARNAVLDEKLDSAAIDPILISYI